MVSFDFVFVGGQRIVLHGTDLTARVSAGFTGGAITCIGISSRAVINAPQKPSSQVWNVELVYAIASPGGSDSVEEF